MMKLSWIVPLYNCGEYIGRCLDSLLDQGLDNGEYEIIVVNDGSTDDGPAIVRRQYLSHPNIKIIDQPNAGLGMARNTGIAAAKGEYIHFVDADDWLVKDRMSFILNEIYNGSSSDRPDIVNFTIREVIEGTEEASNLKFEGETLLPPKHRTLAESVNQHGFQPSACKCLFHHSLFDSYRFTAVPIGEDIIFMLNVFKHPCLKTIDISNTVYCYYMRQGSIMHTINNDFLLKVFDTYGEIARGFPKPEDLPGYSKEKVDTFLLAYVQVLCFTKLLSGSFSPGKIRGITRKFRADGVLPFVSKPNRTVRMMSAVSKSPVMIYICSLLYRKLYLRHIKKR